VNYPLTDDDTTYLRQFAGQAATQGSVAAVTLEPVKPRAELTTADAAEFAGELAELHDELDLVILVRFAPETNGTWYGWARDGEASRANEEGEQHNGRQASMPTPGLLMSHGGRLQP
jgi:hypothetical protein